MAVIGLSVVRREVYSSHDSLLTIIQKRILHLLKSENDPALLQGMKERKNRAGLRKKRRRLNCFSTWRTQVAQFG